MKNIESYLKQHYCRDYFNAYGETVKDGHYFMYREDVEGLVELIIRECADLFEIEYGQSEISGNDVATVLKKHFGVKECY